MKVADAIEMLSAALARQGYAVPAAALRHAMMAAGISVGANGSVSAASHLSSHRSLSEKEGG